MLSKLSLFSRGTEWEKKDFLATETAKKYFCPVFHQNYFGSHSSKYRGASYEFPGVVLFRKELN